MVDQEGVNKRGLKNRAMAYLSTLNKPEYNKECLKRFREATNMTDSVSAVACLASNVCPEREIAIDEFGAKWKDDKLVMLKWLSIQVILWYGLATAH